ncbi:FAD binding domain-containing protein [Anaerocolumna sp. AGMB13025]|uniref:FAD binding domain-containing protein n=1 Tax=Anaerocolumna sp. AGMB13025 TaxID=3039116 RepID=UPI00241C7644|nr:FAD binding domain-containing protein [Anaerocolumna sp. AGMB13025]WFR57948.1 FAD binding domain-containing protein [Anaerocolumna sp. AGMB13025]
MVGLTPKDLKEAVIIKYNNIEAKFYAGGTDFMVRHDSCDKLIFLNQVKELKQVYKGDGYLHIGSGCTYVELLGDKRIPFILKEAIRGIAAPAIRNIGTIGGNICNASPAGDTLPVLYALEAEVVLISIAGERTMPIMEFITGIRKLALLNTELLKEIILPDREFDITYYKKVGARKSQALSKLSFAGFANKSGNRVTDLRIAFGSVGITAVRVKALETKYAGLSAEELKQRLEEILSDYSAYIKPIDDQRSTAAYRKKVCLNLLGDFIGNL